ncbi:FMN-binding protein [bacterium]|nr:FMN-binding protein [bacterium]
MKDSLYTLFYAAVLGTVCAVLLTGVGIFTAPYREANALAEKQTNILSVLGAELAPGASSQEVSAEYERSVHIVEEDDLTLYVRDSADGSTIRAAFFEGSGLWGPIRGFLALEADGRTIRGITFHEQEETPGLGGEIASDWFRAQFKGKQVVGADGTPGIVIRRGQGSTAINEVDGITGATMTCDKVETMLNGLIARIVKE